MNPSNFFILNTFDRSGSTIISTALSKHPKIECLYNPLNSSIFRFKFMEKWENEKELNYYNEGQKLINNIIKGNINPEIIKSKLFFNNSSAFILDDSKFYLIKTTNLHLKIKWFTYHYPNIKFFALLRNPLGILASMVRNNFHIEWYSGWAYNEIKAFIKKKYDKVTYVALASQADEISKMAVIIGVLNSTMIEEVPVQNILRYEEVISNPNYFLNKFIQLFGLENIDFEQHFKKSINSVGKPYEGDEQYLRIFSKNDIQKYVAIFKMCGNLGYKY